MVYLFQFLKKRWFLLALIVLALLGQVAGTQYIPYLIAHMIDNGVMQSNMAVVTTTCLQMLLAALVTAGVAIWGSYLSADLGASFGREMRLAVFEKTQALSVKDFDGFGTSSLITRTTGDITNLQQTIVMMVQMVVPTPLIIGVSIALTHSASPVLTIVPVATVVIFLIIAWVIIQKSQPLSQKIQVRMDKINQVVRESILGIRVIRAFDNSDYERSRSDGTFQDYAETMIALNRIFAALNPAIWLVMGLSMGAVVWMGGLLTAQGALAIGAITAVTEYTIMSLGYLVTATMAVVTLPKAKACLSRLRQVLDETPEICDPAHPQVFSSPIDTLVFDDVTFSYPGAQCPVLKNISFCCHRGETTAIIGSTGSGKSTVASLILRLHDVDTGQIRMGNLAVDEVTQQDLRQQIGYIPQKAFLFSGTIASNLRLGHPNATDEQLHRALSIAQAQSFVASLDAGMESPVSQGGTNFSGGQKQRLAIARALVKEAPVMIFDDSFSALDFKTDAALRRALHHDLGDALLIIIAQRVSTIADADQIIVLDQGEIVGIGTHQHLLDTCPIYQDIAKSQAATMEES